MQLYSWVSNQPSSDVIAMLEQAHPVSSTMEELDQGRILYSYIVSQVPNPNIYNIISTIGEIPIAFTIMESQIKAPKEDSSIEDILGGLQRSVHRMVEYLLQIKILNVQIHYEVVPGDRLVVFIPMQDNGRIYRSSSQYSWIVGQIPLQDIVGWQPISADLLYWTVLPNQPEMVRELNGMLFTKVGSRGDELLRWIELDARSARTRGAYVIPTPDEIQLVSLITLAEALQSTVEIFPEVVRIFVPDQVGFTPKAWIQKNLDRLQHSESLIAKTVPTVEYTLQDRPKVQIAAELAYKQAFPDRDSQIYVLPDLSIIYEIVSIDDITHFTSKLRDVLHEAQSWTLTTLPAQDIQIASVPDDSEIVSFDEGVVSIVKRS